MESHAQWAEHFRNKIQIPIKVFWHVRQDAKLLLWCRIIRQHWKAIFIMPEIHSYLLTIKPSIFWGVLIWGKNDLGPSSLSFWGWGIFFCGYGPTPSSPLNSSDILLGPLLKLLPHFSYSIIASLFATSLNGLKPLQGQHSVCVLPCAWLVSRLALELKVKSKICYLEF